MAHLTIFFILLIGQIIHFCLPLRNALRWFHCWRFWGASCFPILWPPLLNTNRAERRHSNADIRTANNERRIAIWYCCRSTCSGLSVFFLVACQANRGQVVRGSSSNTLAVFNYHQPVVRCNFNAIYVNTDEHTHSFEWLLSLVWSCCRARDNNNNIGEYVDIVMLLWLKKWQRLHCWNEKERTIYFVFVCWLFSCSLSL